MIDDLLDSAGISPACKQNDLDATQKASNTVSAIPECSTSQDCADGVLIELKANTHCDLEARELLQESDEKNTENLASRSPHADELLLEPNAGESLAAPSSEQVAHDDLLYCGSTSDSQRNHAAAPCSDDPTDSSSEATLQKNVTGSRSGSPLESTKVQKSSNESSFASFFQNKLLKDGISTIFGSNHNSSKLSEPHTVSVPIEHLDKSVEELSHDKFLHIIRDRQLSLISAELKALVQGYIKASRNDLSNSLMSKSFLAKYKVFMQSCVDKIHSLYPRYTTDSTYKCFERFVCLKLFELVFHADKRTKMKDNALYDKLKLMQNISKQDLDIPEDMSDDVLSEALAEISKLERLKVPSDFLTVLVNASRIIVSESQTGTKYLGADSLLPALIYCVIKALPRYLESTVQYLSNFLQAERISGEEVYILTQFFAAVQYIEEVGVTYISEDTTPLPQDDERRASLILTLVKQHLMDLQVPDIADFESLSLRQIKDTLSVFNTLAVSLRATQQLLRNTQ